MKDDYRKRREEILKNGTKTLDLQLNKPEVEIEDYDWESHYQIGPETYLMSLKDPQMSSR